MSGQINGIRDPERPERWLVRPWPVDAGYRAVVGHFLVAYFHVDYGASRQLAYFRGYQAALAAAPTDELTCRMDWQWRDELIHCVAQCVADCEDKL